MNIRPPSRQTGGSARPALLVLVVVVLPCVLLLMFRHTREVAGLERQLAGLRAQLNNLQATPAQAKELEKLRAQVREAAEFKKEAEEVHRLRGEITQLRQDKAVFERAKSENAQLREWASRLQADNATVRGQNQSLAQAQAALAPGASPQVEQTHKALCIANLKQFDGAIQQWALENNRKATDDVELRPVLSFLKGSLLPVCPANGVYQPGSTVSASPTCSVPGHTL